jgi:hypothetical protein
MTNGHITRNEAEAEAGERLGAHHLVHNDFTPEFATVTTPAGQHKFNTTAVDSIPELGACPCLTSICHTTQVIGQRVNMVDLFINNGGRVVTFNTWRRFDPSGMRSPLAMCDARSIAESDLIATTLGTSTL